MNLMFEPEFRELCESARAEDHQRLTVEPGLVGIGGAKVSPAVLLRGSAWGRKAKVWHQVVHLGKQLPTETTKEARVRMEKLCERYRRYLERWKAGKKAQAERAAASMAVLRTPDR